MSETVSIAACNSLVRPVSGFDEFAAHVRALLDGARAAHIVLPGALHRRARDEPRRAVRGEVSPERLAEARESGVAPTFCDQRWRAELYQRLPSNPTASAY